MAHDADTVRARAEAAFAKPQAATSTSPTDAEDRILRERTIKLKEMRLAKEAKERLGKEIRADRRRER